LQRSLAITDSLKNQFLLGIAQFKSENYPAAISNLEKAQSTFSLSSRYLSEAYFNVAVKMMMQKDYTGARVKLEKIIAENPQHYVALANLGYCYLDEKLLLEARSYFLKALEIKPDYGIAFYGLGLVAIESQQKEEAISYFTRYISVEPAGNYFRKAQGYIRQLQAL
jgi:tetratricopeptide (TPR) repeat protein